MDEERDQSDLPVEITPDDLDQARQARAVRLRPPPNYGGRAMRLKLYLLVGSLLLVFVLMEQVRDPDLWRRIGFTDQPAGSRSGGPVWTEVRIAPDGNLTKEGSEKLSEEKVDGGGQADDDPVQDTGSNPVGKDESLEPEAVDESVRLWTDLFRGLSPEQLISIAARVVGGTGAKADVSVATVARVLDQRLGSEVTLRLEQISRLSQSDRPRAAAMAESIAGAQIAWREKIRPWLESENGLANDDAELQRFERAMRAVALEKIEDRTGPARPAEGAAWLMALRQAVSMTGPADSFSEPGIYRMMTLPSQYRAAPVRLTGRLMGIEPLKTAGNALGIEKYHVLWIGEESGGNVPACVYLTSKPEGFPGNDSGFTKCNLPVRIEGVFFKLRTYTAADRSSAVCPLILSSRAELIPVAESAGGLEAEGGQLPAGWPWMLGGLIAIAFAAAWFAWRTMHSGTRIPEPEGLRANLDVLAADERILTHREQVARLQKKANS